MSNATEAPPLNEPPFDDLPPDEDDPGMWADPNVEALEGLRASVDTLIRAIDQNTTTMKLFIATVAAQAPRVNAPAPGGAPPRPAAPAAAPAAARPAAARPAYGQGRPAGGPPRAGGYQRQGGGAPRQQAQQVKPSGYFTDDNGQERAVIICPYHEGGQPQWSDSVFANEDGTMTIACPGTYVDRQTGQEGPCRIKVRV